MNTEKKKSANTKTEGVEGEGSYTATRRYNEGLARSIDAGTSEELAQKAKEALTGDERAELERAERIGKKGDPETAARPGTARH